MSGCTDCWDTPCTCGSEYARMSDKEFEEFVDKITQGRKEWRMKNNMKVAVRVPSMEEASRVIKIKRSELM